MKLCVKINLCKIEWLLFVVLNLLFFSNLSYSQNLPPVLDWGIPNQQAEVGSVFSYTLPSDAFKDENNDALTLSTSGSLPSWLLFNSSTQTISGTPTTAGTTTINVTASDGASSQTTSFTINVHSSGSPYAAFTMNTQMGCGYRKITFKNKSNEASTYSWELGNGNTSTLKNPAAIYNTPGTYTVTLKINGGGSIELTHTEHITIYPLPKPTIANVSTTGCEPLDLTLTSTGSRITVSATEINNQDVGSINGGSESYHYWYFFEKHDGVYNLTPSSESVNITNLEGGKYSIILEVTDQYGCQGSTTKQNLFEVNSKPEAFFTSEKANNCEPSLTTFFDQSTVENGEINNYSWEINGTSLPDNDTVSYDFTSSGSYVVALKTTSSDGCVSENYRDTVVFNNDNTADFSIDDSYCTNDTVYLTAITSSKAQQFVWNIDGTIESTDKSYQTAFNTPGLHTISLIVRFSDGCEQTTSKEIPIDEPTADFNYTASYNCNDKTFQVNFTNTSTSLGTIENIKWYLESESTSTLLSTSSTFQHTFFEEQTANIRLQIESEDGCTGFISKEIKLYQPSLSFYSTGATSCWPADTVQFHSNFKTKFSTASSYNWDFGDSQTGTGSTTSHKYDNPGSYDVTLSVNTSDGCKYTNTQTEAVQFAEQPTIDSVDIIQSEYKCFGDGVQLDVNFTGEIDELIFINDYEYNESNTASTSPYSFTYMPVDTGMVSIDIIASHYGCTSDTFTVDNIVTCDPKASFSPSQSTFCEPPYNVTFSSTRSYDEPMNYEWDFGDENTSTLQTPSHQYASTGNYEATLTVTNPITGCSDSSTDSIHIYSFDNASGIIHADKTEGCAGLTVNFSQDIADRLSSNYDLSTYEWDFNNDGIIDSTTTSTSLNYTYNQPGLYSIRLSVTSETSCDYEFVESDLIKVSGPITNFNYSPTTACLNTEVAFTNTSTKPSFDTANPDNDTFNWQFGANDSSADENPSYTFDKDTIYTVDLTVIDQNGCSTSMIKENLFNIVSFTPDFTLSDTIICNNTPMEFTNNSTGDIVEYQWDFDGDNTTDSITTNTNAITYSYSSGGNFDATLTAIASDGCSKTSSQEIRVINATADFSVTESYIGCAPAFAFFTADAVANDVESYLWNFGDGNSSNESNPRNYYVTPGYYTVSLSVEFKGGCSRTITKSNIIHADGAYGVFNYDLTLGCAPNTVLFSVSEMQNVDYITWDFGTGEVNQDTVNTSNTSLTTDYTYNTLGYVTPRVILTDDVCGEYAYDNLDKGSIYTSTPPQVAFSFDMDSVCTGVQIQFTDESSSPDPLYAIESWKWMFGNESNDSSTIENPQFAYWSDGDYDPALIVFNELGCSDTLTKKDSIHIFSNEDLTSDFDISDLVACAGQEVQVSSLAESGDESSITNLEWNFGEGYLSADSISTHTFDNTYKGDTLTIVHKVTDDKFCVDTTTHTIIIDDLQAAFKFDPKPVLRGKQIDYTDKSTNTTGAKITDWDWTFENGSPTSSILQNPSDVTYDSIGNAYETGLIVTNNNNCKDTISYLLNVLNNPPSIDTLVITLIANNQYSFQKKEFDTLFTPNDPKQTFDSIRFETSPLNGSIQFNSIAYNIGSTISTNQIDLLEFIPDIDWFGNTKFIWNGNDGKGWSDNPKLVYVVVLEEPEPPVLSDFQFSAPEDATITITRDDFIHQIESTLGSSFKFDSLYILSIPSSGQLYFDGLFATNNQLILSDNINNTDAIFEFIPEEGYNGTLSFKWNAFDGYNFAIDPANINLTYYNTAPEASNIVYSDINQGQFVSIPKDSFLVHFKDIDIYDTPQSLIIVNLPSTDQGFYMYNFKKVETNNFSINFNDFINLSFFPYSSFEGWINTSFIISDGNDNDQAYIRLNYVNTIPIVHDFTLNGYEDTEFNFEIINFESSEDAFEDPDADQIEAIRIVSLTSNGNLFFNDIKIFSEIEISRDEIDQLSYRPNTNWNGYDSFLYNSSDGTDWAINDSTVILNIQAVNDTPQPQSDRYNIKEDQVLNTVSVAINDIDIDDEDIDHETSILSYHIETADSASAGIHGSILLDENGELTYTPIEDYNGSVYFIYTVCDDDDNIKCASDTVYIDILPVNDNPTAINDTLKITEDQGSATFNCIDDDFDIDGDPITILTMDSNSLGIINTAYGDLEWSNDGNISFTLHNGLDTLEADEIIELDFKYIISDTSNLTDSAIFTIQIIGINDSPVAESDLFTTDEGIETISNIDYSSILFNDTDPESDILQIETINNSTLQIITGDYGIFTWQTNGSWSFNQNTNATDSLKEGEQINVSYAYTNTDGKIESSPSLITFIINGVNDAPVALNDTLVIYENVASITINTGQKEALLSNDSDVDGDNFRIYEIQDDRTRITTSEVGILEWSNNGSYTYTPDADSVNQLGINDSIIDIFNYTIIDDFGAYATAQLIIIIKGINDTPIATDDHITIYEDTHLTIVDSLLGVLSNDGDIDHDPIVVTVNGLGTHTLKGDFGTLTWTSSGAFEYETDIEVVDTLSFNEKVQDIFTYQIQDPSEESDFAELHITIIGQNDAPLAQTQKETINEDDPPLIASSREEGILNQDYDIDDHENFQITSINRDSISPTDGLFGSLEWNEDGTYTYTLHTQIDTLAMNEIVRDSFYYVIEDPYDSIAMASFIFEIKGQNDDPKSQNDTLEVDENDIYLNPSWSLLKNDMDPDGDTIQLQTFNSSLNNPVNTRFASFNWDIEGNFEYNRYNLDYPLYNLDTLAWDDLIVDSIPYTITDTHNIESWSYLYLLIKGINDLPVTEDDFNYTSENTVSITSTPSKYLLTNDYDIDRRDSLLVVEVNKSSNKSSIGIYGTLEWLDNGSYTYFINTEATDSLAYFEQVTDIFEYRITDKQGATATDTLIMYIIGANDNPIAINDTTYINEDEDSIAIQANLSGLLTNDYDIDGDSFMIKLDPSDTTQVFSGNYGTLTLYSDGRAFYKFNTEIDTLYHNEKVIDTFNYTIIDENEATSVPASVTIYITGENDVPIAYNDSLIFSEDDLSANLEGGLLKNDVDLDNDSLIVINIGNDKLGNITGLYGEISWESNGSVTYTPDREIIDQLGAGENTTEVYKYTVIDEIGDSATANLIVYIIGQNDAITAMNDSIVIEEDNYIIIDVSANDIDPDNNHEGNLAKSPVSIIVSPNNGKAYVNTANGNISYFPESNFYGFDSITYRICDDGGSCSTAIVFIEVTEVNDRPVATNLILQTNINTPVSFNALDQFEDIDDGINPTSVTIQDDKNLQLLGDSIQYSPTLNYIGIDEITYSANDYSDESAYSIVTFIVKDETSTFEAQNDSAFTEENILTKIDVLANDTIGGDASILSVDIKIYPTNGIATYDPFEHVIDYTPSENFNGKDSLTYLVASSTDEWDFAVVYITVNSVNEPIIVLDDAVVTKTNTALTISLLNNDSDNDNGIDTLSLTITQPMYGVAAYNSENGTVIYTPDTDYKGNDSFTYTACDLDNTEPSCASASVNILVQSEFDDLTANNDIINTLENSPVEITYSFIISNDIVIDGEIAPESYVVTEDPQHGTLEIDETTSNINYTPADNYYGPDWMSYQICDNEGSCDMAEINIWIEKVNLQPVANDDVFVVSENISKRLFILANDYDPDGLLLTTSLDTITGQGPRKGSIIFDRNTGTILYTPFTNADIDHFTYTICDNEGECTEATATINVNLGSTLLYNQTTYEDTPDTFEIAPLLAEYNLFFTINEANEILAPEKGGWHLTEENTLLVYTPTKDSTGSDYYNLTICSSEEICADLKVNVTITPQNDAPTALNDTIVWFTGNDTTIISFEDILKNDYDIDGDELTLTPVNMANGDSLHVEFNNDNTITVTADTILWCDSWFEYQITDPTGESSTARVILIPEAEGIQANNDTITIDENSNTSIDVLENDQFKDNQRCTIDTIHIETMPANGTAASTGFNTINYVPNEQFYGIDSLEYTITDIWGQIASAWVIINVQQRNMPPVAIGDQVMNEFGSTLNISVLENDYDPDPDGYIDTLRTRINVDEKPQYGTIIYNPETGSFIYTPDEFTCEGDQFGYTIFDNEGDSATAIVTIAIPAEAPLYAINDTVKIWPGISIDFNVLLNDSGYFIPYVEYFGNPEFGTIQQTGDSTLIYFPDIDFSSHDSTFYQIESPCGNQSTAWIFFMIQELRVPEIITPNKDDKNEFLIIDGIENYPNSILQIFNRLGHVVYQKKGYKSYLDRWNGYSNKGSFMGNKPLPSGTYYYTLIYNEGKNRQAGMIYIFR